MNKKVAKKKKSKLIKTRLFTAIFSVMFVVSLFMGINALAETNPFSLTNATIEEKSATTTGSIQSFDNEKVNNDITFHKLNDYVTYKLVIKNNNNDITILSITDDNSNEYIAYEYDKHENEKVNKGSSINFIVKAVYKTELTDTSKRNQTNNVKFTITYLEDGEVKGDTITINPKTGDGISKSFIMLIISSVGLITCIALDKKRKYKKLSKVTTFIISGLLLTPLVVKAATFAYSLSLVTTYQLYDKVVVTIDDKVNTPTTQTIEYNTKIDSLPSPTKTGYTLTNWTVNNEEFDITKEIKEDITIEANYRKNNYTITFNANVPVGGTLDPTTSMADMDMKYDEEKNLLPNGYLVTGYLFDSWNTMPDGSGTKYEDMDSVKNLTSTDGETVTLYARWGATPYTVIFDKNSTQATGTMENISKAYNETFNLPENTYERTGYSFSGWNTSPMGDGTHYDDKQSVKNLDIDGEVTLYAEWSPALITISFDINTDDPEATGTMAGQIVVYDVRNNINENKFTRTGYAFDSWNTEPDGSGTKYDDKADITNVFLDNTTLYVQWAVTPYTVIFNKNGGVGDQMPNQEIAYGQQVALTKNTYTREHYKFLGWNTQEDGQGTHFDDKELVKNLDIDGEVNLYAEWIESTSTLQVGSDVNAIFKTLNSDATIFTHYTGTPDFDSINGEEIISLNGSNFPTYAWDDNGTIYWWSEADTVYLNEVSTELFRGLGKLEEIYVDEFNTSNLVDATHMFTDCTSVTELDLSNWDTSKLQTTWMMFLRTSSLETINFDGWVTTEFRNMERMFDGATSLKSLDLHTWNVSNVTNMFMLFSSCSSLESLNISSWDMRNNVSNTITNGFPALTEFNVTNVKLSPDSSGFFANAPLLTKITGLETVDTSAVTKMNSMFANDTALTELDLSSFDTSKVTKMNSMFQKCSSLTELDVTNFNTSSVTDMTAMFLNCTGLSELDLSSFDTSKVTGFNQIFGNAGLSTIYVSPSFIVNNSASTTNAFMNNKDVLIGGAGSVQNFTHAADCKPYMVIDDPDNGTPGYFSIKGARYIRYNNNGADGSETMTSHYLTNTGSLKANTFTNTGKTFAGWNTKADGSGDSYTDEQLMSDLTESKTPLTLYAQWEEE